MKYHGGVEKDNIYEDNIEAMKKGFANLDKHYQNLKKFGVSVVVCLNKFSTDTDKEIESFMRHCEDMG